MIYGRIKEGTLVSQDHSVSTWPNLPGKEVDPNTRFSFTRNPGFFAGFFVATAKGFGERGHYGNGSIHVIRGRKKIAID